VSYPLLFSHLITPKSITMSGFKKLLRGLTGKKDSNTTQPEHSSQDQDKPESRWSGIDNTQPKGDCLIGSFSTEYLGEQRSSNSASRRDLGFAGHIQGKWYAVYGDTLWCSQGVADPDQDPDPTGFHGMVRNAVSALTDDPLLVHDLHLNDDQPVPHQKQFTPFVEEWGETNQFGFGGTSIVEVDYERAVGAVYYLIVSFVYYCILLFEVSTMLYVLDGLVDGLTRTPLRNRTNTKTIAMQASVVLKSSTALPPSLNA
jgi:hypothetical protein